MGNTDLIEVPCINPKCKGIGKNSFKWPAIMSCEACKWGWDTAHTEQLREKYRLKDKADGENNLEEGNPS